MIDHTIGPYQITRRLGRGGIGDVWGGVDTMLGRPVAIKALRPEFHQDKAFVERFRTEATNMARLQHPNITSVFALHAEGDRLYIVMELVLGHTLEDILRKGGRLDAGECRAVMAQVISGIEYAHGMGVIHRDIKPANLMVTAGGLIKIMDFGIARIRGSKRMTRDGQMVGTLAYMAPEQFKGGAGDERSDLYSLGVVLYEMASGRIPFDDSSEYDLIRAHVEKLPPPLRSFALDGESDPIIEAALMTALAKVPEDRFASIEAFGQALAPLGTQKAAEAVLRQYLEGLALPEHAASDPSESDVTSEHTVVLSRPTVVPLTSPTVAVSRPTVLPSTPAAASFRESAVPPPAAASWWVRSRLVLALAAFVTVAGIVGGILFGTASHSTSEATAPQPQPQPAAPPVEVAAPPIQTAPAPATAPPVEVTAPPVQATAPPVPPTAGPPSPRDEPIPPATGPVRPAGQPVQATAGPAPLKVDAGPAVTSGVPVVAVTPRLQPTPEMVEQGLNLTTEQRRQIQVWLSGLGFNTHGKDGSFGAATRHAVADYQQKSGIIATGYLSAGLIRQLENDYVNQH